MKHSKEYLQGYNSSDDLCPYVNERELWVEAGKYDEWHKGRQAKLDELHKIVMEAEYEEQVFMTKDELKNCPYLVARTIEYRSNYNPNFGDDRMCECGHPYYRHFDWMDDNIAVGCKYCGCSFTEKK